MAWLPGLLQLIVLFGVGFALFIACSGAAGMVYFVTSLVVL